MTVFSSFWKVVNKYKGIVILYSVILLVFGGLNMKTSDKNLSFVNSKPDVLIVNLDKESVLANNFINYFKEYSNIKDIDKENLDDALFYRDVNYIIYIPEGYTDKLLNGENVLFDVKSTGDYNSTLAQMYLTKYLKVQNAYAKSNAREKELVQLINKSLKDDTEVLLVSDVDISKTSNMTLYFNFASYSIMAAVIFVICLVMSSFKETNVNKRIIVSSMNYKKYNRSLLFSSFIYAFFLWLLFVGFGFIILRSSMFSLRGLIYSINSFFFVFCSLTIALFISTVFKNKEAISGLVNVIALGSAFLCGAFVPAEWLPTSVLYIAHVLPAYYYINSNDLLKVIEVFNFETLKPIIFNCLILLGFSLMFIILNNVFTKYKRNNVKY